jgi:hypothetical protein
MAGNTVDMKSAATAAEEAKRERSTIAFPYNDLDDAMSVATAIHTNAGVSCDTDQLAAYMNQSATGGSFRLTVSTARIFGLTENDKGRVSLTELGRRIVDPAQERRARAEAFLNVPLYRAIYDKYKGHMLPPAAALEREMATLGVSSKQTDKARQAFERSATQAAYFEHGKERLVMPAFQAGGAPETIRIDPIEQQGLKKKTGVGGGGGGEGSDLHPFILGLLTTLPQPKEEWPVDQRVRWLQTASGIFDLIYTGNDGSVVSVSIASNARKPLS